MATFKRDNVELDIPDSAVPIIRDWLQKADSKAENFEKEVANLTKQLTDLKANADGIQAKLEETKAAKEAAEGKLEIIDKQKQELILDNEAKFIEAVRRRVNLEKQASDILGEEIKLDYMSDRQIKEAIIKSRWDINCDGRSDEAIEGMLELTISNNQPVKTNLSPSVKSLQDAVSNADSNQINDLWKQASSEYVQRIENGWKLNYTPGKE